ncbi:hypothetical protein LAZ67_3005569 [Cordylochernes scorpioides]|uniref:Uncharacterized protein n=1 Tax=Cordylochernes scorpioides TaxID=51811 RepID=A0ABY6KDV4_9ARAC|nr:hypothetical protein LAZ67_3005569 [Cordylochernes scorpioides]
MKLNIQNLKGNLEICPFLANLTTQKSGNWSASIVIRIPPRAEAKTSLEDDDVPIDDTTTQPLFTPQEKGRKGTRDKVPRLRWNPWQKHVKSTNSSAGEMKSFTMYAVCSAIVLAATGQECSMDDLHKKSGDLEAQILALQTALSRCDTGGEFLLDKRVPLNKCCQGRRLVLPDLEAINGMAQATSSGKLDKPQDRSPLLRRDFVTFLENKEGIFVGPSILKNMKNTEFETRISPKEKSAWVAFKNAVSKFLGNYKNPDY